MKAGAILLSGIGTNTTAMLSSTTTNPTARLVVCGGIAQRGRIIFSMRANTGTTRWIDADK